MPDMLRLLQDRFAASLTKAFGSEHAQTDPLLRPAANAQFGDYQANLAMGLAKTLGMKPRDAAMKIVEHLQWEDVCEEKPGVAGPGFINLKIKPTFLAQQVVGLLKDDRLGVAEPMGKMKVVVDYSGPNVAKEMHVGHLRSTVIGDAIARVLAFVGHEVVRQNHLGDWGTQFGMLIEYMIDMGARTKVENSSDGGIHVSMPEIRDLNTFYQQAKAKFDGDSGFSTRARNRVVKLQGGDAQTLAVWHELVDISKAHFESAYEQLNIDLTDADIRAESFYNDQLPGVVAELEQKGLAQVSDGAVCVFAPGFQNEEGKPLPLIVRKSDGGYLYATTDLAALKYRVETLQAQRIIYVTDARQKQHFAMVFKTAELAGWVKSVEGEVSNHVSGKQLARATVRPHPDPLPEGEGTEKLAQGMTGVRLDHVPFGTVLGEDGKPFKTRSGDTVKLADLLDEAEERAYQLVTQKNSELPEDERHDIGHKVGIGAIKYADLCNDRIKDYVFSWERMLSFDGNTAPYLQNAYVRIRSIFRKHGKEFSKYEIHITDSAEKNLALKLLQFPAAVAGVAESLEPHRLCTYLYELAATYHQFYEKCPVLTAPDEATRNSRLALCEVTARTLKQGLNLLGIEVVDRM